MIGIICVVVLNILFPSRDMIKCPAIMLAISRMAREPGRTIFLIVSMHAINGVRMVGVPSGIRWANIC